MHGSDARSGGRLFRQVGLIDGQHCTCEDCLRGAHKNPMIGGDAFYRAGSLDTIGVLNAVEYAEIMSYVERGTR